mgnify:CR=1 FL=1
MKKPQNRGVKQAVLFVVGTNEFTVKPPQVKNCAGCAVRLTWRDIGQLCNNCRHTEKRHRVHTVRPGRPCPTCNAEVIRW